MRCEIDEEMSIILGTWKWAVIRGERRCGTRRHRQTLHAEALSKA